MIPRTHNIEVARDQYESTVQSLQERGFVTFEPMYTSIGYCITYIKRSDINHPAFYPLGM